MYIYGDISSEKYTDWYDDMEHTEVYPKFVVDFLKAIEDKELHIHINSPGGNAYAGVAIYNLLKERKGKTVTHIDCIAASAASLIALAGDEIVMSIGSVLMIHRPWIRAVGNSDELRKTADDLDKLGDCIFEIYKNSLANSEDEKKVRELYNSEAWLSNADCVELFKNIKIDLSDLNGGSNAGYFINNAGVISKGDFTDICIDNCLIANVLKPIY